MGSATLTKPSTANGAKGEVVDIRQAAASRKSRAATRRDAASFSPAGELTRYQQSHEKDDYRHRMMTNSLAFVFLVLLIIGGIWIADTMAAIRKNQDCVLSGRRGCTPVEAPPSQRW